MSSVVASLTHRLGDTVSVEFLGHEWSGKVYEIDADIRGGAVCPIYRVILTMPDGQGGDARIFYHSGDSEVATVDEFRIFVIAPNALVG